MELYDLPIELLVEIFCHLRYNEVVRMSFVSRYMRDISYQECIWKSLFERTFVVDVHFILLKANDTWIHRFADETHIYIYMFNNNVMKRSAEDSENIPCSGVTLTLGPTHTPKQSIWAIRLIFEWGIYRMTRIPESLNEILGICNPLSIAASIAEILGINYMWCPIDQRTRDEEECIARCRKESVTIFGCLREICNDIMNATAYSRQNFYINGRPPPSDNNY